MANNRAFKNHQYKINPNSAYQRISHWLLLLRRQTDYIEFYPADFGVSGDTIQSYVQIHSRTGGRKYRVSQGQAAYKGMRDETRPVIVRLLVRQSK